MNPGKNPECNPDGLDGWAFMMRTKASGLAFLYFQNRSLQATLKGFLPGRDYQCDWFDPRTGNWVKSVEVVADASGMIVMPEFPGMLATAQTDWAVRIKAI